MSARLTAAILLGALTLTACSSGDDGPTNAAPACSADVMEMLNTVAVTSEQGIQGFAGCQPDPDQPGAYVIRSTVRDLDLEAVRTVLIEHDQSAGDDLRDAELRLELLDIIDLAEWYQEAEVLSTGGLPRELALTFNGSVLDELNNRILVYYADEEARSQAQELFLREIDAPPGVVLALYRERFPDD